MSNILQWEKQDNGGFVSDNGPLGKYEIAKSSGRFILFHLGERLFRGSLSDAKATAQAHADSLEGKVIFPPNKEAVVVKFSNEQLIADDETNRTPDAQLDASEREDQPEEVEKGKLTHQGWDIVEDEQGSDPLPPESPAPSADTTDAGTPAPESDPQHIVTDLFRRHGTNCPKWLEWPEMLSRHGLTPNDVTPEHIRKATKVITDETKEQIHRMVKPSGNTAILENLLEGTRFRLGTVVGELLSVNGCDAKVKVYENGKPVKMYWSPATVVEVITGEDDPANDNVSDDILIEVTFMQVKEAEARQMFTDLGLPGVDRWNEKKLTNRLNSAVDFQDKADKLEGESLSLYKSVTDSLGEGEVIELWQDEVVDAGDAVESAAAEPVAKEKVKKVKKTVKKSVVEKKKRGRPAKVSANGKANPDKPAGKRGRKPKVDGGMSGLDAAFKVLADAGKPMNKAEILEAIFKKKLWHSDAATPGDTIKAAMLTEINKKGKESRFKKAGKGLFAVK